MGDKRIKFMLVDAPHVCGLIKKFGTRQAKKYSYILESAVLNKIVGGKLVARVAR